VVPTPGLGNVPSQQARPSLLDKARTIWAVGESIVHSRQMLGTVALGAIVVAAVSFAIVDASIAAASGCMGTIEPCPGDAVPVAAITFSVLGVVALLISIVPAVTWIIESVQVTHSRTQQSDLEVARHHRARRVANDDYDS
jgi:hypothetical protein